MSTDVRSIILETARRLFGSLVTPEILAGASKGVFASDLWSRLEENGFTAVDDEGLTYADGLALLQVAGYYAVPVPLAESILASKILADLGMSKPTGLMTLALVRDGEIEVSEISANSGVSITGRWSQVPWARVADAVVVCAPTVDGKTLIAVAKKGDFTVEPHHGLASEPLDIVTVSGFTPETDTLAVVGESLEDLLIHAALTRVLQASGTLERVLDLTVQYAGERNQFGRPIAKFQAVQQQIAQMAAETAAFLAMANKALQMVELNADAEGGDIKVVHADADGSQHNTEIGLQSHQTMEVVKAAILAKIRLAQAALVSPTHAHQVHGAMGFTEEYVLHHYTRRVWSFRHEYGNERFWAGALLKILGHTDTWAFITG